MVYINKTKRISTDFPKIKSPQPKQTFNFPVDDLDSDLLTLADFVDWPDADITREAQAYYLFTQNWQQKGTYLYRRTLLGPCDRQVRVLDPFTNTPKNMIMMAANDYLGLSVHPKVIEAAQKAIQTYGTGSGGAPMLSGTFALTRELEERVAAFKHCEDAMLFSSGYAANLATISAMVQKGDAVITDRLNHASIVDGTRLSQGEVRVFRHNDMDSLERELHYCSKKYKGKLIVVDGLFSMDGDFALLPQICELAQEHQARVLVDDAHATGVLGLNGGGSVEYFELEGQVDFCLGTFSKALASSGGFIASSKEVINYLRSYGRSYLFSTAQPPSTHAAALASLDVLQNEPERIHQLWNNVYYLYDNLRDLGFNLSPVPSPIIVAIIGDDVKMRKMSRMIHDLGLFLNAVPYPAVSRGQSRLRISLMSTHTRDDLDQTIEILEKVAKEFGVI